MKYGMLNDLREDARVNKDENKVTREQINWLTSTLYGKSVDEITQEERTEMLCKLRELCEQDKNEDKRT